MRAMRHGSKIPIRESRLERAGFFLQITNSSHTSHDFPAWMQVQHINEANPKHKNKTNLSLEQNPLPAQINPV